MQAMLLVLMVTRVMNSMLTYLLIATAALTAVTCSTIVEAWTHSIHGVNPMMSATIPIIQRSNIMFEALGKLVDAAKEMNTDKVVMLSVALVALAIIKGNSESSS